jgi:YHS domain-containing protein
MFKRIVFIAYVGIFFFAGIGLLYGEEMKKDAATDATLEKIEVGNKVCPVSGDKIDDKARATYEYQGKVYNFCCPACIDEFKKDPDKYIKKVNEELEPQAKEEIGQKEMRPESGMPTDGHEMHH